MTGTRYAYSPFLCSRDGLYCAWYSTDTRLLLISCAERTCSGTLAGLKQLAFLHSSTSDPHHCPMVTLSDGRARASARSVPGFFPSNALRCVGTRQAHGQSKLATALQRGHAI